MFNRQYFSEQYFPAVWFAPADESHVPPDELRPEFRGGGGPDASDAPRSYEIEDDEFLSPQLKQYVARINEAQALEREADRSKADAAAQARLPVPQPIKAPAAVAPVSASARVQSLAHADQDARPDNNAARLAMDDEAAMLALFALLVDMDD